jgi:hypothetical protein
MTMAQAVSNQPYKQSTRRTHHVQITQTMARDMLKFNVDHNRKVRLQSVAMWLSRFRRGEYLPTHQGIAFDSNGNLIDGQHRLLAALEMPPGFTFWCDVTVGLSPAAFAAIDSGLVRSPAELLGIPQGLSACGRFLALVAESANKTRVTVQFVGEYSKVIEPTYNKLIAYTAANARTWSSAAVKSAAILRLLDGGDEDYILLSYRALVVSDFETMSPIIQALYRQLQLGRINTGAIDLFIRCWRAFDVARSQKSIVQISDQSLIVAEVRNVIRTKVLNIPVDTGPGPAPGAATKKGTSITRPNSRSLSNATQDLIFNLNA